jgi:hypothetical protein
VIFLLYLIFLFKLFLFIFKNFDKKSNKKVTRTKQATREDDSLYQGLKTAQRQAPLQSERTIY